MSVSAWLFLLLLLVSCRSAQLAEGEHYLGKVSVECDNPDISPSKLMPYVRQANTNFLQIIAKKGKRQVFDKQMAEATKADIQGIMNNNGYMQAAVTIDTLLNAKGKMDVVYKIQSGRQLFVDTFQTVVLDTHLDTLLRASNTLPDPAQIQGKPFDATLLNNERKRITDFLLNNGYSKFNKDFITIDADTMAGSDSVSLLMTIEKFRANSAMTPTLHPKYYFGNITYKTLNVKNIIATVFGTSAQDKAAAPLPDHQSQDSLLSKHILRPRILEENTMFDEGQLFSYTRLQQTYNRFGRLGALRSTQIILNERPDTNIIDAEIQMYPNLVNSFSFQPEGTNTAGNLGAAASITYSNKNIFRGSELFSLSVRGAFEAITGLEGYNNSNYIEFGAEGKIDIPRLLAPLLTKKFRRRQEAVTQFSVSYNMQNRPEFRRRVFRGGIKYKWSNASKKDTYTFDLIDLNYISMPWISDTFRIRYLEDTKTRNAILRYNYQDLFIMKTGISISHKGKTHAWRMALETAGNILSAIAKIANAPLNEYGQRKIFRIAFAQYVKIDLDYTKQFSLSPRVRMLLHGDFGIAIPYGNSNILPFEKRYFAGGPNSVRGWAVRSLGPGRFRSTDGSIDFINQTGDMKLNLNAELRGPLFWKFNYAVFLDAGNIWTLRNYDDQPGGQFQFNKFLRDLAVAYGVGLRLNFDFFILRFDFGMKAINPAYTTQEEHFPVIYPDFKRDFAFHFAVGMPF